MTADSLGLSHGVPLSHAVRSDVGRVRGNNEDAHGEIWLDDGSLLVLVCDGMGGHEAGEVASRLAVETIVREVAGSPTQSEPASVLHAAILAANQAILAEGKATGKRGMGTTAIVAWIKGRKMWVGQVGDSRFYRVRRGSVLDRSVDHTRVQVLLSKGLISAEEARDHPESGMLTRALGHARMANGQAFDPEVYAQPIELQDGDVIVLSSDGLHDLVEDHEIGDVVGGKDPMALATALVDLALDRGGHDNVTVSVVAVGDPSRPAPVVAVAEIPVMEEGGFDRRTAAIALVGGLLLFAGAFVLGMAIVGGAG